LRPLGLCRQTETKGIVDLRRSLRGTRVKSVGTIGPWGENIKSSDSDRAHQDLKALQAKHGWPRAITYLFGFLVYHGSVIFRGHLMGCNHEGVLRDSRRVARYIHLWRPDGLHDALTIKTPVFSLQISGIVYVVFQAILPSLRGIRGLLWRPCDVWTPRDPLRFSPPICQFVAGRMHSPIPPIVKGYRSSGMPRTHANYSSKLRELGV
jgi:hypothetical protein